MNGFYVFNVVIMLFIIISIINFDYVIGNDSDIEDDKEGFINVKGNDNDKEWLSK